MWMTNVCSLFKTDAKTVDYTITFLMKAPGRSEKTKDFEKSRQCICCVFKPSGREGEIIELKARKKYWYHSASAHRCRLRPRGRGGPAVTDRKRAARAQRFVLVAVIPLWFLLCIQRALMPSLSISQPIHSQLPRCPLCYSTRTARKGNSPL